jgi:hypothetical protein
MVPIRLQGWYYLAGGLWPLVHFRSFEAVAGPKPDRFQTEVTSVLFSAIGTALLVGARGSTLPPAVRALAVASALGTAYTDLKHRRQVRVIFQLEAALELTFAAAAVTAVRSPRRAGNIDRSAPTGPADFHVDAGRCAQQSEQRRPGPEC